MNNIPSDADTETEDIKTIYFEDQVLDFDFHPTKRYLVSSLVSGQIFGHTYSSQFEDAPEEVNIWDNNQESCRGVRFTLSGDDIVAIYKDASWIRLNSETFQQVQIQEESHSVGLNSLCVIDHNVIATGDEDGIIKLWDVREKSSIAKFHEHEDYITDMSYVHHKRSLVSVGGDGYLSVYDLRKKALLARSDQQEEELLSISVIKNGKKLLVGTQEGILSIWDWGSFGDMSDRMKGHQLSVDSICKIDEDTVCTGCSDGNIRVVGILPNKIKGILGTHKDMPVDKVKGDPFSEYVVSCSQDYTMTFWDAKELFETGNLPDDPKKKLVLPEPKPAPVDSDDSEIEDEDEDENDYISEDESDSDLENESEELEIDENSFEDHGSPANLDGFINDLSNTDNVASGASDDDFDSDSDSDVPKKKKDNGKRKKKEKKPSKTKQAKKMKQFFSDL